MRSSDNDMATTLEDARKLFVGSCDFMLGVATLAQLPATDTPEVAFAGRSNVGKSSLLNALTGRKALARVSNTPGRTRELNFFDLGGGRLRLVDLPGYGYARASRVDVNAWTQLVGDYLRGRVNLRRVCLLIDARHGLKPTDIAIMDMLDESAVPYQITLTKSDKIKSTQLDQLLIQTAIAVKKRPAAFPTQHATSSTKHVGLADLRADLASLSL